MALISEKVAYLREHIGIEMLLYIAGLEKGQEQILEQTSGLPRMVQTRVDYAYDTISPIISQYDGRTASTWLFGDNQTLGGAPAKFLRDATSHTGLAQIVALGRAFSYN